MLMTALIVLPGVAFASPPDSVWVPGIYDGADGDDVVQLVTETVASNDVVAYQLLTPALSSRDLMVGEDGTRQGPSPSRPPRGPPYSFLSPPDVSATAELESLPQFISLPRGRLIRVTRLHRTERSLRRAS